MQEAGEIQPARELLIDLLNEPEVRVVALRALANLGPIAQRHKKDELKTRRNLEIAGLSDKLKGRWGLKSLSIHKQPNVAEGRNRKRRTGL